MAYYVSIGCIMAYFGRIGRIGDIRCSGVPGHFHYRTSIFASFSFCLSIFGPICAKN
ncbi:hypothetical protein HanRHA438_Chr02g0082191 [Helianthus annuus]|nr:hypothetical protein HanRHA438_Chr02g0082191 [Helianthus annuus]